MGRESVVFCLYTTSPEHREIRIVGGVGVLCRLVCSVLLAVDWGPHHARDRGTGARDDGLSQRSDMGSVSVGFELAADRFLALDSAQRGQ